MLGSSTAQPTAGKCASGQDIRAAAGTGKKSPTSRPQRQANSERPAQAKKQTIGSMQQAEKTSECRVKTSLMYAHRHTADRHDTNRSRLQYCTCYCSTAVLHVWLVVIVHRRSPVRPWRWAWPWPSRPSGIGTSSVCSCGLHERGFLSLPF